MRIFIGQVLMFSVLLLGPWDAGASVLRHKADILSLPLKYQSKLTLPDCTKEMETVEGSTEIGLNSGLLVVHISDIERNENYEEGASACHRWRTKARFDSKGIDIDRLDEGYKRVYADVTLSYRFVHLGETRRFVLDPGVNVVLGGDSPPKVHGWVHFSAHKDWEFRFQYRQDRAAHEVEDRLHMEARAIRRF